VQKRKEADRMFYQACRTGDCSIWDATILYIGVRIGAAMPNIPEWRPALTVSTGPHIAPSAAEERIENDFRAIAEAVLSSGETDDVCEIERRTDSAMTAVTGVQL